MNIARTIKNMWIDILIQRKFLGGRIESIDDRKMIWDTVSSGYDQVENIFFSVFKDRINPSDIIVDVGCGKGRVFNYLLYRGMKNKMIGYEINAAVGNAVRKNLSRFKNVSIISENIFDDFPLNGTIFYLFNPFRESMMEDFKEQIWSIKENNPVILYYNPTCLEVFNDKRFVYKIIDIPISHFGFEYKLAIIELAK